MFVCLKRLVRFLTFGLWYIKVAHRLFSSFVFLIWVLCCNFVFSLVMCVFVKLLFCAVVCFVSNSVCRFSSVSGSDSILLIWYSHNRTKQRRIKSPIQASYRYLTSQLFHNKWLPTVRYTWISSNSTTRANSSRAGM